MSGFSRYQTSAPARPTLWPPSFEAGIGERARRLGISFEVAKAQVEASRRRGLRRGRQARRARRMRDAVGC